MPHQNQKDNQVIIDKETSVAVENAEEHDDTEALEEALREGVMEGDPII